MNSLTVLRYNNDEEKFEEVKKKNSMKNFFFNYALFFRLHMMLVYNGQQHVNSLMMIHFYVQKMEEI